MSHVRATKYGAQVSNVNIVRGQHGYMALAARDIAVDQRITFIPSVLLLDVAAANESAKFRPVLAHMMQLPGACSTMFC